METTTIFNYFQKRYDVTILNYDLPLVVTTKKGVVFPLDVVSVRQSQKYPYRLDDQQASRPDR